MDCYIRAVFVRSCFLCAVCNELEGSFRQLEYWNSFVVEKVRLIQQISKIKRRKKVDEIFSLTTPRMGFSVHIVLNNRLGKSPGIGYPRKIV